MRLLLSFVSVLVVAGCTSAVESKEPPPHACAPTFAGKWNVVSTTSENACNAPLRLDLTVTIDDALTTWTEALPDGTSSTHRLSSSFDVGGRRCSYLATALTESVPSGTQVTGRELVVSEDGTLTGRTTIVLYATDDFTANGANAAKLCEVGYWTDATR